jgi:tetratricopeptide (TPR) repeat protein
MNEIKTDLDLADQFSSSIFDDYQTALEFLTDNPDYSLLKFRKITEELCVLIAEKMALEFSSNKLNDRINTLDDSQIINRNTKNLFHDLRILCNDGVHNNNKKAELDNDATFIQETKNKCLEKANTARKYIIELFEDTYLLLKLGKSISKISYVDCSDYGFKKIIFDAAISSSYLSKLKAGIAYETIAKQATIDMPLFVDNTFKLHHDGLLKLAANHYESAYKLSFKESTYHLDAKKLYQHCDAESLFRYAVIAVSGVLSDIKEDEAFKLIKIAADRGYNEAIAYYGAYLYDEERYDESKEYLNKAMKVDSAMANRYLFYIYSEVEFDPKLAMEHLEKAIELGCSDSIGELGALYHKGFIVDKDIDKAETLLLDGISKGSYVAKRYHLVEFNDLVGKIQKEAKSFFSQIESSIEKAQKEIEDSKPKPIKVVKIGRNAPCSCGSNKKYKQCCGKTKIQSKPITKNLNIFN